MKKMLLLFTVFCLIASTAIAQAPQLGKGNIMLGVTSTLSVGGSHDSQVFGLAFGTEKWEYGSDGPVSEYKFTSYNFLPKAGYFIIDNLVAGLEVVLSGYSQKAVDDGDIWKESTMGIGPFVRYYYPLEKVYPYAEAEVMFGTCKEVDHEDEYKDALTVFGIYLGAALPLGDKITIDASAGYMRAAYKWDYEDVEGGSGTDIIGGFGIKIGFSIYL